jgi:hypothetical protein
VVLREKPGKKLLRSENGIQKDRAGKTKEQETRRVLPAGHLDIRINRSNAIDKPLNWKA